MLLRPQRHHGVPAELLRTNQTMDDSVWPAEYARVERQRAVPPAGLLERHVWPAVPGHPRPGRRPHRSALRATISTVLRHRMSGQGALTVGAGKVRFIWGDYPSPSMLYALPYGDTRESCNINACSRTDQCHTTFTCVEFGAKYSITSTLSTSWMRSKQRCSVLLRVPYVTGIWGGLRIQVRLGLHPGCSLIYVISLHILRHTEVRKSCLGRKTMRRVHHSERRPYHSFIN